MASVADFVPFVTAYTGELPEVYEQHFIRRAIQSFMEDTRIAREELYVELDCNEKDFILDLPNCRRIVKVEDLWEDPKDCDGLLDEQTWTLLTPQGMARGAQYRYSGVRSYGYGTYRVNKVGKHPNRSVILNEGASKPRRFCVIYSWKIGNDDCEVPDFILDDWVEAIANKTLVFAHNSLDFEQRNAADKAAAQAYYDACVNNALNLLRADYTKGMIRLKTPRFY